jgi:hypothetical protein
MFPFVRVRTAVWRSPSLRGCARLRQAQGRITGSVVDTTNRAVASVTITLTGPNSENDPAPTGVRLTPFGSDAGSVSLPGFLRRRKGPPGSRDRSVVLTLAAGLRKS